MSDTPYVEFSFLMPMRRDELLSDGGRHSKEAWEWLRKQLWDCFGGATLAPGEYQGFYTDPDTGMQVHDKSRKYIVALSQARIHELYDLLSEACVVFGQKSIYLSIAGTVDFVEHPDTSANEQ